jgi:hypothetical protein
MIKKHNNEESLKGCCTSPADGFVLDAAAIRDLPHDNISVSRCYICKSLGHPNEPIKFKAKLGRILFDGTSQIIGYKLVDYITDEPHKHKEPKTYNGNQVKSLENYFPMSTEQQHQQQKQKQQQETLEQWAES